jgi:hypothetical protein
MPVLTDLAYKGPELTTDDMVFGDATLRPDWRWERVLDMVNHSPCPLRNKRFDDSYVRTMRQYMLQNRGDNEERKKNLFFEYPGCYHALKLHQDVDGADMRLFLQSRFLARQSIPDIASEWYEKLFFNVSDRISDQDWILRHILGPEASRQLNNYELAIKMLAYHGGVSVLNFMLTGCRELEHPQTPEEVINYVTDYAVDGIIRKAALAVYCYTPNKYKIEQLLDMARQAKADMKAKEDETDRIEMVAGAVRHTLEAIEFIKGDMAEDWLRARSPQLLEYDGFAAELRDQQVYAVVTGNLASVEHMRHRKFPEAPKRESKLLTAKDGKHEDPLETS